MTHHDWPDADEFQDPLEDFEPKTYNDPVERLLAEASLADVQHVPFAVISPKTTVAAAVARLDALDVGCLMVVDDGQLVGVLSDRDLLDRVTLEYDRIRDRPVETVMTRHPVYVYETDSPAAALAVMAVSGHRHVPVLSLENEVVGIVSPQRVTGLLETVMRP